MKFCILIVSLLLVCGLRPYQAGVIDGRGLSEDLRQQQEGHPIEEELLQPPVVDEEPVNKEQELGGSEDELLVPDEVVDEAPASRANECSVNIKGGVVNPSPVFIKTGTELFYPYSETGTMLFNAGGTVEMFCPSQFKSFAKTLVTASCVGGSTFKIDGVNYQISDLTCKSWPSFVAEKEGRSCNGGTIVRAGFKLSSTRFIKEMEICFNEQEEVTRYVRHTLDPASTYYQTGVDRLTFQTSGFFAGKDVDKLYTQVSQMDTINAALGGNGLQFFDLNKNVYLARGHMAAKADFVYGTQQRATFLFLNVAPQWQVFNAGNWARVEDGLRSWVSQKKKYVNCYTGVHGVTTLPDNRGVQVPLYLTKDHNNNGLIPVPKIYFRVVIEPATKKGIVFVGVNNPHLSLAQIQKDYILCKDVSDQVNYIPWKKTSIMDGYSYACEVGEFLKVVKNLPYLTATGGLLV